MSAPNIPDKYTVTVTSSVSGGLDLGLDDIRIKEIPTVELKTFSRLRMGLDDIRIKELPKIDLGVTIAMKPTRIHLPLHLRFCLSSMGMELLAFSICGEGMVVIEDYVPHRTELCR
jgi:hypothetical protein